MLRVNEINTRQVTQSSKVKPSFLCRRFSPHGTASKMLYVSGRSNGSRLQRPSADLDGATLVIAFLVLETEDASEIGARLRVLLGK